LHHPVAGLIQKRRAPGWSLAAYGKGYDPNFVDVLVFQTPFQSLEGIGGIASPIPVHDLDHHQPRIRGYAHALSSPNQAGTVGAVAIVVIGLGLVVHKVLEGQDPARERLMTLVRTGIDEGHIDSLPRIALITSGIIDPPRRR